MGGGFYSDFAAMTASEAWALFGEGNGAASLEQMLARISRYRRTPIAPGEDPVIGCVFIRDACFFPPGEAVPPPPEFAANIVQGKGYDLSREPAAAYFGYLIQRMLGHAVEIDLAGRWNRQGPVFGDPRLAPQRLGQQAFKARVLVAYGRGAPSPVRRSGPSCRQPISARSPTAGSTGWTMGCCSGPTCTRCSTTATSAWTPVTGCTSARGLREQFGNGEQFYEVAGQPIALPTRRADRPGGEFLEWHLDTIFKAS